MVHETYTNSESALAHITGVASKTILPKIFNISKLNRLIGCLRKSKVGIAKCNNKF
jgi:hypothetical protein